MTDSTDQWTCTWRVYGPFTEKRDFFLFTFGTTTYYTWTVTAPRKGDEVKPWYNMRTGLRVDTTSGRAATPEQAKADAIAEAWEGVGALNDPNYEAIAHGEVP